LLEDFERSAVFLLSMHRLTTIVAMALLALWIPATSLCLAENAGVVADIDHCADSPSSQASPCCVLASAAYKLDDNGSVVVPWPDNEVSLLRDTFDVRPRLGAPLVRNGYESPPELRSTWQFSARAAANPRAPSFAS
jgi:hypothetical protein